MKSKTILIGIAISLSISSFTQVLSDYWPDTISIPQEQFKVKQRAVAGSVCLMSGTALVFTGREISRGKLETTIHPDNFFFSGYSLIGMGVAALISAYLKSEKVRLLIRENEVAFVLRL